MINPKDKLKQLVPRYFQNKEVLNDYKKTTDADNAAIKEIMLAEKMDSFEVDNIKATCSVTEKLDFDELALIEKLKELKIRGVVKKKEYVDMDALENAIYNNKIEPAQLAKCQTRKETVTLRIKLIK